jgi:hypothetical protein
MDYHQSEYEVPVNLMAAIKCQDDRVGERGARPEWLWEHWQHDFIFRPDSEVWGVLHQRKVSREDLLMIIEQRVPYLLYPISCRNHVYVRPTLS